MRTEDLISAIAADAATPPKRLSPAVVVALLVAAAGGLAAFMALLGPRPDAIEALGTARFPLKFAITLAFALAGGVLALRLARPGASLRPALAAMGLAVALLAVSVIGELAVMPSATWEPRLVGRNWFVCLVNVPILSAIPLVALLIAFRRGAPGSPMTLGSAAGLLAGAIGATFYAAHCPDDSPLFVAAWYGLSVGLVTLAGAAIGSRFLRW